jgi:hypothetical protein
MYILTEQVMNGTVTIETITMLVDAPDFQSAKDKMKALLEIKKVEWRGKFSVSFFYDTDDLFQYSIKGGKFPTYGRMENKQPTIL